MATEKTVVGEILTLGKKHKEITFDDFWGIFSSGEYQDTVMLILSLAINILCLLFQLTEIFYLQMKFPSWMAII